MVRKRYTEEQIIAVLNEAETGARTADLCRKHGMSDATFYNWKAKYAGLTVSELKEAQVPGGREPASQADCGPSGVGQLGTQGVAVKKLLKPKARRIAASYAMEGLGLSERRACQLT